MCASYDQYLLISPEHACLANVTVVLLLSSRLFVSNSAIHYGVNVGMCDI